MAKRPIGIITEAEALKLAPAFVNSMKAANYLFGDSPHFEDVVKVGSNALTYIDGVYKVVRVTSISSRNEPRDTIRVTDGKMSWRSGSYPIIALSTT